MKKRGQVTLFIIIGIIILIVGIFGIMYREQIARAFARLLFPEAEPLRVFIERCSDITGEKAIELAARQGGYISIPGRLALSYDGYLPPPPSPIQVPMWWYKGASYVPTKQEMELQISQYIEESLTTCLDDFDAFAQFDVIEKGNLTVETDIHENDVRLIINYPLLVRLKGTNDTIELERFYRIQDKPIGKLHELAFSIMELENSDGFIENITMDMIAIADGAGDSPYFPHEGFDIRCGVGKVWSEQFQLIPDLQNMLHYNLNYVTFKGTNYIDPGYEYFRDQYSFRASQTNYPDVQVKIIYNKNWGMELDVQPSDGDIVRGFEMPIPLIGSCLTVYHHRYDIEYPVMFQLLDLETGLVFNFATPIIIEKNLPKRYISPFTQRFEYRVSNDDYCADRVEERTVVVRDKVTGDALENVSIRYECLGFACELGKTSVPTFDGIPIYGATASLTTRFPVCLNGILVANKEGYLETLSQYSSGPGAGSPPATIMTPLKRLNLSVRVLELSDNTASIRPLENNEVVVIFIRNQEIGYDETFFYPPNEFYKKGLELIYDDLKYEIDAKLVRDDIVTGGMFIGNWTVTRNTLSAANEIIVNVITSPTPPTNLEGFSAYFNNEIVPKSEKYQPVIR